MTDFSKKLFWNIVFIIIIFFIADFFVFYNAIPLVLKKAGIISILKDYKDFYSKIPDKNVIYNDYILGKDNFYRRVVNENSKKKPILLFGCSFVYGHEISEDKIFSEVLGKYTGRPIYNRARQGFGVSEMLFQLQNEDFYKIIPQPEYIIYTYIWDHIRRMYLPSVISCREYYDIRYENKDGVAVFKKMPRFHPAIFYKIGNYFYFNNIIFNKKSNLNFYKLQLLTSKKLVEKNWKGTKFVIFLYQDTKQIEEIIPELEQAGFIIIKRKDIAPFEDFDPEFSISDGQHPNEKAWDYIVPRLIKRLNIN